MSAHTTHTSNTSQQTSHNRAQGAQRWCWSQSWRCSHACTSTTSSRRSRNCKDRSCQHLVSDRRGDSNSTVLQPHLFTSPTRVMTSGGQPSSSSIACYAKLVGPNQTVYYLTRTRATLGRRTLYSEGTLYEDGSQVSMPDFFIWRRTQHQSHTRLTPLQHRRPAHSVTLGHHVPQSQRTDSGRTVRGQSDRSVHSAESQPAAVR